MTAVIAHRTLVAFTIAQARMGRAPSAFGLFVLGFTPAEIAAVAAVRA